MRFSSCPHESSQSGYDEKPLKFDCWSNHDEQQGEFRMKAWKIKGRFPTADEMSRMVAAEVRTRVKAAVERATRGIG